MHRRTTDVRDREVAAYLFVCTHTRDGLACCADADGEAVLIAVHEWLEERNVLYSQVFPVETSCLGLCGADGAAIGVFPHDEWFSGVTPADVPALLSELFGSEAEQLTQETGHSGESAISD